MQPSHVSHTPVSSLDESSTHGLLLRSFSMTGTKGSPGLIPQLNTELFRRVEELQVSPPPVPQKLL